MLFQVETFVSEGSGEAVSAATSNAGLDAQFIINPYLGLIGLCVLIITGAVAVIREIQIEDNETDT